MMLRLTAVLIALGVISSPLHAQPTCVDYRIPSDVLQTDSDSIPEYARGEMAHAGSALWISVNGHLARYDNSAPGVLGFDQLVPIAPYYRPRLTAAGGVLVGAEQVGGQTYVFTVSTAPPYAVLASVSIGTGSVEDLEANGAVVVVTHSNDLTTVDVSNPLNPSVIGSAPLPVGSFQVIATQGSWAFVGSAGGTSPPPTLLFYLDPLLGPQEDSSSPVGPPILWDGDLLYTRLGIWNVANVQAPTLVASLSEGPCPPDDSELRNAAVANGNFFTTGDEGIWGWNPDLTRSGYFPSPAPKGLLEAHGHLFALANYEISVYEVAGRDGPQPVSRRGFGSVSDFWDLDVEDGEITYLGVDFGYGFAEASSGYGYWIQGSITSAASCAGVEFADMTEAVEAGKARADFTPDLVVAVDGATLVAQNRNTSTPSNTLFWLLGATDIQVIGDRAYVPTANGLLHIIDVSTPETPVRIGLPAMPGVSREMQAIGSRLYFASDNGGILVYDVTNADAPALVFSEGPGTVRNFLHVNGDQIAAVETATGTLHMYDLTNPDLPVPLGSLAVGSGAQHVAVEGRTAYVNCGGRFAVVDLLVPTSPQLLNHVVTHFPINGMAADSDYLYILQNRHVAFYPHQCEFLPPTSAPARRLATLINASPNPFVTQTQLGFEVSRSGPVTLAIVDVAGRLVRSWNRTASTPGRHTIVWDGRTRDGARAAAGVYFIRLTGAENSSRKVVRLR